MPLRTIHTPRTLLAGVIVATALALAPPASAAVIGLPGEGWVPKVTTKAPSDNSAPTHAPAPGCPVLPSTKAYARFGDNADYTPAPGGTFEAGQAPWIKVPKKLSAAVPYWAHTSAVGVTRWLFSLSRGVLSGNDGNNIMTGARSLKLDAATVAVSPRFCVDRTHPHFRFSFKASGADTSFSVRVLYYEISGALIAADIGNVLSSEYPGDHAKTWQISPASPLSTLIPELENEAAVFAHIFVVQDKGGASLDNFMVDPYRPR